MKRRRSRSMKFQ